MRIVFSTISSLLLMGQSEAPLAVWYHFALLGCTMVSEVKRLGVQEMKISIKPNKFILLTDGCPTR